MYNSPPPILPKQFHTLIHPTFTACHPLTSLLSYDTFPPRAKTSAIVPTLLIYIKPVPQSIARMRPRRRNEGVRRSSRGVYSVCKAEDLTDGARRVLAICGDLDRMSSSDGLGEREDAVALTRCTPSGSTSPSKTISGAFLNLSYPPLSSVGGIARIHTAPSNIGTPVPIASKPSSPLASPPNSRCPRLEKKKADSPNPASTAPVAEARVVDGKERAVALTEEARPAEPAAPVRNIAARRGIRRRVEGGSRDDVSERRRNGWRRYSRIVEYPVKENRPPRSRGLYQLDCEENVHSLPP